MNFAKITFSAAVYWASASWWRAVVKYVRVADTPIRVRASVD
jgi:hypothetical protein